MAGQEGTGFGTIGEGAQIDVHFPEEREIMVYVNIQRPLFKQYPLNLWCKFETKLLHKSSIYLLGINNLNVEQLGGPISSGYLGSFTMGGEFFRVSVITSHLILMEKLSYVCFGKRVNPTS